MSPDTNGRRPVILLVEDNEVDVELTRESFSLAGLDVQLYNVKTGEDCLAFLRKTRGYADVPTPDLTLLDLNMPLMDGREVMAELAASKELCHLPVVILTTSDNEFDVRAMYRLRCNAYIIKPVDFNKFRLAMTSLVQFWFGVAELPISPDDPGSGAHSRLVLG